MFKIVMAIILVAIVIALIFTFIIEIKNDNAYKNHKIILDAIYDYRVDMITSGNYEKRDLVDYQDMETYNSTLYYWGCGIFGCGTGGILGSFRRVK